MRDYLLVDDNMAFAENLAEILRDDGARVTVTHSGDEALQLVSRHRFDALLSDMRMPGMGGAELVRRMRQIDAGLPAIVVSAYTDDNELTAARREGLLAVLPKPVPIASLLTLMRVARRDALVAVIEHDVALADSMSKELRDCGFSTIAARSLLEIEQLRSVPPFVALIELPLRGDPDGIAMLRLSERFPGIPLVVMSGSPDALAAHSNDFLAKPFTTAQMLEAVEKQYRAAVT